MQRFLTVLAAALALTIALLLPVIHGFVEHRSTALIMATEVEINGRLVSELINTNPELWKDTPMRLEELLRRRPGDRTPEVREVRDLAGVVVAATRDPLDAPTIAREGPVFDSGEIVGTLRIQRSLRPLLARVAQTGALAALLGCVAFLVIRILPLRALRRSQAQLAHESTHDAVTGLPNRVLLRDRLAQAMARSAMNRRPMALLHLDLDGFKDVNAGLGHAAGDDVLRLVSARLAQALAESTSAQDRVGGSAFVARLGSDEFSIVVDDMDCAEQASALAERALTALRQPCMFRGRPVTLSASIGIATCPQHDADVDADILMRQAELAMHRAKTTGGAGYQFFHDAIQHEVQQRIALIGGLRGALERGEFVLHYQPKADLRTGGVTGFEALLRWQRPGHGLMVPDRFIPALEESGLIVPVGAWVIETACAQLAALSAAGHASLGIAVNLSARQFREPGLADRIRDILERTGVAPQRLELELTESLLMEDSDASRDMLDAFARIGVRVAIDDFGTGHSSLAYLKRFRVHTLKIDRSFIQDVPHDSDNCAISNAVVALAHSMRLEVVCEGVETVEQVAFLKALGCEALQGFLLARPMPAEQLEDWLTRYARGDESLRRWQGSATFGGPARAVPAQTRSRRAVTARGSEESADLRPARSGCAAP